MKTMNGMDGFDRAKDSATVVVFDFTATWCGPCKMTKPILERLEKEYEKKGASVSFYSVDIDENEKLCRKFGVKSVPTVMIFVDGKQKEKMVGADEYGEYKKKIDQFLV